MSGLTVTRWKRYGKDRLYVNDAEGQRVGWVDLHSGEATLERAELAEAFAAALVAHERAGAGSAAPRPASAADQRRLDNAKESAPDPAPLVIASAPVVVIPPPPPVAPAAAAPEVTPDATASPPVPPAQEPWAVRIEWRDVGTHKPGKAAAEQAVAHQQAAPVRTFIDRLRGTHTHERAWRVGANGEAAVGAELERLPDTWTVLHAVPVGTRGSDIDHVVIGPPGAFTVNTKHHPEAKIWVGGNTIMVNGQRQPYVRNSRHEATRAAGLLEAAMGQAVPVRGVIAIVGAAGGLQVKEQPADVHVVSRAGLRRWLLDQPAELSGDEVGAVVRVARRSDTWQS